MAKYLAHSAGNLTEVVTPTTSAGAADAGKIIGLDASGRLDVSVMPTGIGADTQVITASEALAAGDFVNVHESTGAKVRKASAASVATEAHGYVLAAVASAGAATVYFEGTNATGQTGLTGGDVYLSPTTPGKATSTVPATAGQIVQVIGVATSATAVNSNIQRPVILA
jgi:hypothetical protein